VYNDKQTLSLFLNWFRQLAVRGYIPPNDFAQIEQEYRTKEEVTSMLIKALEREREAIRQQAVEATKKSGNANEKHYDSKLKNGIARLSAQWQRKGLPSR
jgi:hypothetical protein